MSDTQYTSLKNTLDGIFTSFDFRGRARLDPIKFPKRYKKENDAEVAAFIAAALSYGRVELFMPVIEKALSVMGSSPHSFLVEFDVKKQGGLFGNLSYRFQSTADVLCLLNIIGSMLRRHKTLKGLFMGHYNDVASDIGHALAGMVGEMHEANKKSPTHGLSHMLPSPLYGSACKRLNLFLRWVVRDKDIDLGIWREIPKSKLVIPLDTHIMAVSRRLGLTRKKTASWKAALEITSALKTADPDDPLKYDFPLCHTGMARIRKPGK